MGSSARKGSKSGMVGDLNLVRLLLVCLLLTPSAFGQLTARNPVDELKDQVTQVLTDARGSVHTRSGKAAGAAN